MQEDEHASEKEAAQIVDNVWKIIESSASYLFNASHALCVACDSLYVAWLKAHHPYELYATMLEIFSEKKNKEKVASIISEMKRLQGISITPGRFRQDNRTWFVDKENHMISQNLSSIRFMQKQVAEDLYKLGLLEEAEMGVEYKPAVLKKEVKTKITKLKKQLKPLQKKAEEILAAGGDVFSPEFLDLYEKGQPIEEEIKRLEKDEDSYSEKAAEIHHMAKLDCFTNVLRALQMNSSLNTRQIEILIGLNYFAEFGKTGKLMAVFNYFFNGEKKLTKSIHSFEERLELCRQYEASLPDAELPAGSRLRIEYENVGLCLSTDPSIPTSVYFITEIDEKYTPKVTMYSIHRGTTGTVKIAKKNYKTMAVGSCIQVLNSEVSPKYSYRNGHRTEIPGEKEIWLTDYSVMQKGEANVA